MYHVKIVRGRGPQQVVQRAFAPCPNYTVTIRPEDCPAVLEGDEDPGIDVEFWPEDSPEQVTASLPRDGDSIYITTDQPLRSPSGEFLRDAKGRFQGVGRTVDAFHWPLESAGVDS